MRARHRKRGTHAHARTHSQTKKTLRTSRGKAVHPQKQILVANSLTTIRKQRPKENGIKPVPQNSISSQTIFLNEDEIKHSQTDQNLEN